MKGSGHREERESIISLNEAQDTASVWTASEWLYRRLLKRLGRAYLTEDGERHAVFTFPKEFITLPKFKARRKLNPGHRAKLAANARRAKEFIGATDKKQALGRIKRGKLVSSAQNRPTT